MKIAVTGGTGFLGRYILHDLVGSGHSLRCWHRPTSVLSGLDFPSERLEWIEGGLKDPDSVGPLVDGCDALVHAALDRPGVGFRGAEGDLVEFATNNIIASLRLFEVARSAGVGRIIFISSCAVHEKILSDRPLDETHPTWATSHYGAHKAAIDQFVYSTGLGEEYPICALRPCGIYGLAHPVEESKWYELVKSVVQGESVTAKRGGKEVHARDVAKATSLLLRAPEAEIAGQAFNCCDQYIANWDVAQFAKEIAGSRSEISGERTQPKNQIETSKLKRLGMEFGGDALLKETIREMVDAISR